MKTSIKLLATSLLFCLLALNTRAIIIFQDNFSYTPGTLTNSAWVAGAGNPLPANAITVTSTNTVTIGYNGTSSSQPRAYFTNGFVYTPSAINFPNPVAYFPSNSTAAAALYTSFTISLNGNASSGTYFAYITDTNFDYGARIYTTNAPGGGYQLAIQDTGTYINYTNLSTGRNLLNPAILAPGQNYNVVVRFILSSGLATLWVNPTAEDAPTNVNSTTVNSMTVTGQPYTGGGTPGKSYCAFGLRNASGLGQIIISNLIVATTFEEVLPSSAGINPPFVVTQPQDNSTAFSGGSASFTNVAGGDAPLTYQWYYNTNTLLTDQSGVGAIIGSTSNILTLTNLTTDESGTYDCVVTNSAGTNVTRYALLTVYSSPLPPAITNQPAGSTNTVGDTVTFSVVAGGVPPPAYRWFFVTNGVTNAVSGANVSGINSSTLTITGVTTNQAGFYFVTITNFIGTTNSDTVPLVVNSPLFVNISTLRSMVDENYEPTNPSLFTIQGIVTSWTNTTSSGNCEFYVQDATAGIAVFWSGANGTNIPPGGAKVQITAPLENPSFNGLLSLEPVYGNSLESVTIISTNNPLPAAQPLPMDPNVTFAQLKALESSYVVASNVTLAAGATFVASANEYITNNIEHDGLTDNLTGIVFTNHAGDVFTLYVNNYVGIAGQVKPSGPVTIYGILGFSSLSSSSAGFEFTPTRYADIISYIHITNILSIVTRKGDLLTNSFTESVLRPGDTLTTYVSIGDPEGGNVTLTPSTVGLPPSASWSDVTGGQTGSVVFHFSPLTSDASSNYVVSVGVTSTSGNDFNDSFNVYVPTPTEQQIYITEILANPTTNASSPAYNPLERPNPSAETNAIVDRYVEIANLSGTSQSLGNWNIGDGSTVLHTFDQFNSAESIASSNAFIIYNGPPNGDASGYPTILGGYPNSGSGYIEPISAGESLTLNTNGGVIALHNSKGYLVDRVAYPASALNTSFSRFPTLKDVLVPQAYISTNFTTAGLQYDGGAWNQGTKVPAGVTNVTISIVNKQAVIHFTANTNLASTLWQANEISDPFTVINGKQFTTTNATFSVTNLPPGYQFYFISTQ